MSVNPIRLKLAYWEALGLKGFLEYVNDVKIGPETRNETIVLMEYSTGFYTKCFSHALNKRDSLVTYQFPLSVARILHYRLQHHPTNAALQSILSRIDQQLTNRKVKPSFEASLV